MDASSILFTGHRMTDAFLSFSSPNHIPVLFGAHDRYLRQVRDAVGIDVTLRGDEVRLRGNDEQVKRGLVVFHALRAIIEDRGELLDADVLRVLQQGGKEPGSVNGGHGTANGHGARSGKSNANGSSAASASEKPPVDESINLFEKARRVLPRSPGQAEYVRAIRENDLVFCEGPAGCGKTYLAVAMALNALRQDLVKKIVLVRPAVEAGEKLGFLPGDLIAKVNPFLRPLLDALNDMLDYDQVKRYMDKDVIEIVPLAFMRGRTLNHTFIILDEGQNSTVTQMKMFLTRLGTGSQIVITGDTTQTDLGPDVPSGMVDAIARLAHVEGVAAVELTARDIVRHPLVKEIVKAYEQEFVPARPRPKG